MMVNVLCAPLFFDGRVIAVLYLENPMETSPGHSLATSGTAIAGTARGQMSGTSYSELAVQLIARLLQQAAPRLHSLMEMERLAELIQLRREMTEALRTSEERFRSIFNSSPVLIFLTDVEGRLIMVNDYWLQALGYSRLEAVSHAIGEFCSPSGRTLLAQQIQSDPRPGHQFENLPIQFVRRNGALLDALVSGVILHSEVEGYNQCLSFAIDMTAHRRAEQELDRYRRRLEELVRERTQELSAANRQLEQDILRRTAAESQLLRSQQFLQATLDALSEKLAILDASGAIVALNSSWHGGIQGTLSATEADSSSSSQSARRGGIRRTSRANEAGQLAYWHGYQIGADYLTALRGDVSSSAGRATRIDSAKVGERFGVEPEVVADVEAGLALLLTGEEAFFQMLYRLGLPGAEADPASPLRRQTWYSLRAIRFESGGETYIAVAHDDVTDRKEAEEALLEAAAVNERHRLARELHDSVTQALYSMALFVDATRLALDVGQMERAVDNLVELRAMSRGAMEDLRALIFELHPPELAEIGLVGALREYLKNYQHRTQIDVRFEISGEEHALPVRTESELYRVAQEALNNCFKHARAQQVMVSLHYQTDALEMTIADNGQGFDVELAHLSGGMGVRGMMERIRTIGGRLDVESAPQQGAQVHVRMTYGDRLSGRELRG
jgi:PAS domain S-box-containing protein